MPIGIAVAPMLGHSSEFQNAFSAQAQSLEAQMAWARAMAGMNAAQAASAGAQNYNASAPMRSDEGKIIDLGPEDFRVVEDVPLLEDKSTG